MEMNNVRVGELRCYILNQKDPGSNPTIKMKKRKFTQEPPIANWEIPKFIRRIIALLK